MSVTKEQLSECVCEKCELKRRDAADTVESLLELMKATLESGEDILISGFGKFCVQDKRNRRGRNPQTGENLMLGARRIVTFRPSGVIRKKLNGQG